MRFAFAVATVSFVAGGLGCARGAAPAVEPIEVAWVDREVPRTIDLSPWVKASSIEIEGARDVAAESDGLSVTLTPRAGFTGRVDLPFEAKRGGRRVTGVLPVRVKERRCASEAVFGWEGVASDVKIAGSWNGFQAMIDVPEVAVGYRQAIVPLPAGDHAYKLVVDSAWILDPATPLTMWVSNVENSRAVVPDCASARFEPFDVAVASTAGGFVARVAFVEAASGGAPAAVNATLDGAPVDAAWDAASVLARVEEHGLLPGKHRLALSAGGASLEIPIWIDGPSAFDWREAVAYFVFTDRFRNGDLANDAPENGVAPIANWSGGDWAGLTAAIEEGYFDDLGVNVLWISPQIDNAGGSYTGLDGRPYAAYHGYWPIAARDPEEHFGTTADLRAAVDAAHARGMRVMLDVVLNHVHEGHPYWTANQGTPWFHPQYVCGWDQPIECWFAPYLPDLDHQHLDATKAVVEDALWWADATGADAFRVDAVKHFEHVVGRTLAAETRRRQEIDGSRFLLLGETFVGRWADGGQTTIKEYVSPAELDGQFDFPLYWELVRTIGRGEGTLRDLERVIREEQGHYGADALMGTFLGNHDVARFLSHANGDIADLYGNGAKEQGWTAPPPQPPAAPAYAKLRSAFTVLFALPGMPTIYYGDEIGLAGAGDPDNRRPMPWSGLSADQTAVRAHVAALGQARRSHRELTRGVVTTALVENDLLVIERAHEGRFAYAAVNRGASVRTIPIPSAAPAGTVFTDVLGGASASVVNGAIELTVPASGSALWVMP